MSPTVVLHVHSGNLYGGIETVVTTLLAESERTATVHHVALCFEGRLADELRRLDVPVHPLGAVRLTRPLSRRAARLALRRVMHDLQPDVTVTYLPWTHAVFGSTLRTGGRPVVQWVHGPITGPVGALARRTLPDAVICNSAHTREGLPAALRALPAGVILNPVRTPPPFTAEVRRATRAAMETCADDVVIVQASRLERGKGHSEHLRALARLGDVAGWVLWIVGGPQRPGESARLWELQALAQTLGIAGRVRFAGEQAEVARFLASADLYCQPNTGGESFGLAYVEAMLAGLPVVASDVCGLRDIITPATGVLVRPGDIDRLAAALRELVVDGAARTRLSRAGASRACELTDPARQSRRVLDFLEAAAHA